MEIKAPFPTFKASEVKFLNLIEFFHEVSHLKQLFRQGWLKRGIKKEVCESVADHSYMVALLSMFLVEELFPELDLTKVLRMAMVHDLAEIYVGDLTPVDPGYFDDKYELERDALAKVMKKLNSGDSYLTLWEEYENKKTPEAKFVREVDRLEMALQAGIYESHGFGDMTEFFDSSARTISSEKLRGIFEDLQAVRPSLS